MIFFSICVLYIVVARNIISYYYTTIISFCIDTQIKFNLRYYQRLFNGYPLLCSITSSNGQIGINACRDWCHQSKDCRIKATQSTCRMGRHFWKKANYIWMDWKPCFCVKRSQWYDYFIHLVKDLVITLILLIYKNKIYLFSEKLFDLSKPNGVCSDEGATTILTEEKCRSAISEIPGASVFGLVESDSEWPKGCYLATNGHVYWNNHKTGSPNKDARQVCNANQGM